MELLDQIKKLKSPVRFTNDEVRNPLASFERTLTEVRQSFELCCQLRGISFAEFLDSLERDHVELFARYWRLWDLIDCDVFDRWCEGRLTAEGLRTFDDHVDQWKNCAREMINAFESERKL